MADALWWSAEGIFKHSRRGRGREVRLESALIAASSWSSSWASPKTCCRRRASRPRYEVRGRRGQLGAFGEGKAKREARRLQAKRCALSPQKKSLT